MKTMKKTIAVIAALAAGAFSAFAGNDTGKVIHIDFL